MSPPFGYSFLCAAVVVEGATVTAFVTETATMLVIGLILNLFGIGLFCWLIFTLAIYALPFFVGLSAGMAAFHSGAGVIGALIVGIVAGALTLGIGQIAFAVVRPLFLRAVIAAAFAVPAAIRSAADRRSLPCLAPGIRFDWSSLYRRHGLGANDGTRGAPIVEPYCLDILMLAGSFAACARGGWAVANAARCGFGLSSISPGFAPSTQPRFCAFDSIFTHYFARPTNPCG